MRNKITVKILTLVFIITLSVAFLIWITSFFECAKIEKKLMCVIPLCTRHTMGKTIYTNCLQCLKYEERDVCIQYQLKKR